MRRFFFRQQDLSPNDAAHGRDVFSTSADGDDGILMSASLVRLTRIRALRITRRLTLISCLIVVAIAALALAGWTLQTAFLHAWWGSSASMSHQAAAAVLLGAGALALLSAPDLSTRVRGRFRWCVVGIVGLCILTFVGVGPDRMLPLTSFCLLLFSIALWLVGSINAQSPVSRAAAQSDKTAPAIIAAQLLLCLTMLLSLMSFYGAVLGVTAMPGTASLLVMSLPSSVAIFVLSIGALCLRPDAGIMRLLADGGVVGIMMRRLIPAATMIPLLLGWLRLQGEQAGFYDTPTGVVLVILGSVLVFNGAIWHNARLLQRLDERRRAAERALQKARDHLEDEVRARTAELLQTNEDLSRAMEERRQAQALSTQFSAILDTLVRSAAIGFTFIDRDLRYVAINDSLARMNGLPVEAHIGRLLRDVFPELARSAEPILRRVMESGEPIIDLEVQGNTHGSGGDAQYWLASYYPVRRMDGEILGVGIFAQDVTARKRAEAERDLLLQREREARIESEKARQQAELARAEAETANRTKDEFLATLSHELRTPLNAILGWASLLSTGGVDAASTQKALETIERNARAQTQIIEDILDVSRIVTGKLRLELSPLNLWTVLQTSTEAVRPTVGAKNIALHLHPDRETLTVLGDATRLQQVLWNLLSNAVKFTPSGGRIDVFLQRVGQNAEIEVRDSGQGIEAEFLPFVFDRFRQADASSTRRHGGLGLGLALVRHIVELHGGTISAQSAGSGAGSSFRISLPLVQHFNSSHETQTENNEISTVVSQDEYSQGQHSQNNGRLSDLHPLQNIRILVVEDQPDTREMLHRALESYGAKVCLAANAEEARREYLDLPLDIVVSDIEMPDENGYDLLRSLRQMEKEDSINSRVPAIALSAHARAEDRLRASEAGFGTHVAKPFQITHLLEEILRLTQTNSHKPKSR